jgi:hypothetical protein
VSWKKTSVLEESKCPGTSVLEETRCPGRKQVSRKKTSVKEENKCPGRRIMMVVDDFAATLLWIGTSRVDDDCSCMPPSSGNMGKSLQPGW